MKKAFAALLAIFTAAALAGCSKPADEQLIEDITEDTSFVTEVAETVSETETTAETENVSETVSETEETSAESVSETEDTESETSAVTDNETNSQNNITTAFPVGKWTENRAYIYDFKEDGTVVINTGYYDISGTYTYENNVLTLNLFDSDNETNTFSFDITACKDGYKMDYKLVENEYGFHDPYEPAGLMSGYYSAAWNNDPFYLKKGEYITFAEIEDIKGIWVDEENSIYIFGDNKYMEGWNSHIHSYDYSLKNGRLECKNDEDDESYVLNIYDGKIYMNNSYYPFPIILKRTESEPFSIKDFDSSWEFRTVNDRTSVSYSYGQCKNGKGNITCNDYDTSIEISLNNDTVTLNIGGEKTIYTDYFVYSDASEYYDGVIYKYVYLFNENDIVSFEITIYTDKE